jgi:uncharacterized protein (DUF305 family)
VNFSSFSSPLSLTALLLVFFASTACTGTEHTAAHEDDHHQHHQEQDPQHRQGSDLEELYWSRIEESRSNFTQADVDFMVDMIAHHAQALIMSRLAPENDAGAAIQRLAARIINAQDDEIATMQKWLRDRGQAVPIIEIDDLVLSIRMEQPGHDDEDHEGHGHHHHGHDHHDMSHHDDMPGMLTQDQLDHLATLSGTEFDRTFLKFMIEHHEGAVIMVQHLFDSDGAGNDREAFDLASDIHAEQVTEINLMHQMLEQIEE